jgi:hypothetical protein
MEVQNTDTFKKNMITSQQNFSDEKSQGFNTIREETKTQEEDNELLRSGDLNAFCELGEQSEESLRYSHALTTALGTATHQTRDNSVSVTANKENYSTSKEPVVRNLKNERAFKDCIN